MALTDYKVSDAEIKQNNVKSAMDRLTGTAQENKDIFDKVPELIAERHNDLIEALANTELGTSASEFIGSAPIDGVLKVGTKESAKTVREQIEAVQNNITEVVAGSIPDGSISAQKLQQGAVTADNASVEIAKTYIMPRPPINDVDVDYPIGCDWYIPKLTLNNLFKSPNFEEVADWSVSNASREVMSSSIVLTGGNGAETIALMQSVNIPSDSEVYVQCNLIVGDTTGLERVDVELVGAETKSIVTITDCVSGIAREVFANVKTDETTSGDVKIRIKACYTDADTANEKVITISDVCAIDKTEDFKTIPVMIEDEKLHEAIVLMSESTMFTSKKYIYAEQIYRKISAGVWRAHYNATTLELSKNTAKVFTFEEAGEETLSVDKALEELAYTRGMATYTSLVGNVNVDMLESALGKNNEERVIGIGMALAMFGWYKGESYAFENLQKCQRLRDISANPLASAEVSESEAITTLLQASTFAQQAMTSSIFVGDNIRQSAYGDQPTITVDKAGFYRIRTYGYIKASTTYNLYVNGVSVKSQSYGSKQYTGYGSGYGWTHEMFLNVGDEVKFSGNAMLLLCCSNARKEFADMEHEIGDNIHSVIGSFYGKGRTENALLHTFEKAGTARLVYLFNADAGGGISEHISFHKADGTKTTITTAELQTIATYDLTFEAGDYITMSAEGNSNVNNGYGVALVCLAFASPAVE